MNAKSPTASRLETARDRLEKAIGQIESALDDRKDMESGLEEAEQTRLRLTEATSENTALRSANDEVSRRLDGVIGRLKAVLEE